MAQTIIGSFAAIGFGALLMSCATVPDDEPPFLAIYSVPEPREGVVQVDRQARIEGTVEVYDSCFVIKNSAGRRDLLAVPDGSQVSWENGRWTIVGGQGQQMFDGQKVVFGGGFSSLDASPIIGAIPSQCRTSQVAGLDVWPD